MIHAALADVRGAVDDWRKMQARMAADADRLMRESGKDSEDAALLRWLEGGMLTQLGHVTRTRAGRQIRPLGVCRTGTTALLSAKSYGRAFDWFEASDSRSILIVKSNLISQVHRRVPLDLFIVPVRENGAIIALSVHAGVWTSAAMAAPPSQVPRLRARQSALMNRLGFDPGGHDGKAFVHALTRLPHDLLIAFENSDLERVATCLMSLIDRPRPRAVLVKAPLRRHLFAFVWLPRDVLSTTLRRDIMTMLAQAAEATVLDWTLEVEDSSLAALRFVLDIRDGGRIPSEARIDAIIKSMVRGWGEAVEAELLASEEESRAATLAMRFADAFPVSYRTTPNAAAEAARDILRLRGLAGDDTEQTPARDARFHLSGGETGLRLKLYQKHGALALSDTVPMLENFGFRVAGETSTLLQDGTLGAIHDFELQLPTGFDRRAIMGRAAILDAAVAAVSNGAAENDPFNRLIAASGLTAREANWLRAWYRYLRQTGMTYGIATAVDALAAAPDVTRALLDLFAARHDPAFTGDRSMAEKRARNHIREGLGKVAAINDDRLLRLYRALVESILRTNAFVPDLESSGRVALSFKIDSATIPGLPKPVPWREIFVYSRRVEGIHLRAGPVARGGLRWSDRRDDFRTEVLGLMKAQRVKNAVIVPTGAKGGFYPKRLPDPANAETGGREGWLAEGKASYEIFVRSLLSITDNIEVGAVVHPAGVVVRDDDDPYFVVAADKGTASYSDTANAIAAEHDFWLDDAFASGGSKGYDHKAMGITARGAWLSVQRHFLELGIDVQSDPVRVAGCGDMSGDVFGNGMLLSQSIRLVAAFDHRHIFLDPDPDALKSWAERSRLFALPRSSWADYDTALISRGGGVFPRSQKSISLSPEVRAMLGIEAEETDPDNLIGAILRSPVDLLWFGGIGTYVKAAGENNVQVGDPANDAFRVNGEDVRARVIGEGANLGCTQAGRIDYALRGAAGSGGRINTDFIDNSAGVDCSDNEVNIKIALAAAKREGSLTEAARVKLLRDMTDEVSELVLEDNRLQALALSIAEAGGAGSTASHVRLIEMLEERGHLDRKTEGLADNETLLRRAADGRGLTRPELAVLLSSAKLALQDALEHSALPDDPGLADEAIAAFPARMRKRYRTQILSHRLRREIIATELANRMVNRIGLIHAFELVEEEGATLAQVTAAFVVAERLFRVPEAWQSVECDAMPERARILLFGRIASALRPQIADLLRAGAGNSQPSLLIERLDPRVRELRSAAGDLLGKETRRESARLQDELIEAGASEPKARLVSSLYELDGAVGIAQLSDDLDVSPLNVAGAFIALGAQLGLDWAQATAARMNPSDPWERLLASGLARDFQQMRLAFLRHKSGGTTDLLKAVEQWAGDQAAAVSQFRSTVERARTAVQTTPAMLAQIAGQARNLLAR
jgi:glutamate dehydrogenase